MTGINGHRDWADCGRGGLKSIFISTRDIYVSCENKRITSILKKYPSTEGLFVEKNNTLNNLTLERQTEIA